MRPAHTRRSSREDDVSTEPGGWLVGRFGGCGHTVEIVPFPHGYESGSHHCWARVVATLREDDHACRRRATLMAYARVGVHLCTQHYEQAVRSGLRVCRLPRDLLERLLRDLDTEETGDVESSA